MAEEILVNVTPQETRVALVENGVLQEVTIERGRSRGLVGNIYKGRISRVLPGMGAAFVEAGLARTAFLHVSDILSAPQSAALVSGGEQSIEQLLSEGQEVLVQVTKDPLGSKGARLSTRLCLPSRYLVFMPDLHVVGISQRIENEGERERLRQAVLGHDTELRQRLEAGASLGRPIISADSRSGGYIVRTAAEGVPAAEIQMDMEFVRRLWEAVTERIRASTSPAMVYEDLPLVLRTMRDLAAESVEKVRIDSKETCQRVEEFARKFLPDFAERIEHYDGERPVFDLYSVEDEIHRALERRVDLKSGGHLVIDQTEAMTTIDVNTGGYVGHRTLDETIFKTNLEAAQAIARQLRLRNLGGIIIIDFIDMNDADHQRQVLRALEKYLERDHTKASISELTSLGLVQVTRKRTRESLEHVLCETCQMCNGRGTVKSAETVCYEILREILREARQFEAQKLLVVAAREVVDHLLDNESNGVAELETFIGRPVRFQVEPSYTPEQYDVVLL